MNQLPSFYHYRGYDYWQDYEGYTREGAYTLRIAYDDNEIKAYHDLEEFDPQPKAEAFIDGYLAGIETGKRIGRNFLRIQLNQLLQMENKS